MYSTLYRTIQSYHLRNINKRFGLNLKEFLELPREFVELLFSICKLEDKQEESAYNDVKNELDQYLNR